jgi:hypothetical protein
VTSGDDKPIDIKRDFNDEVRVKSKFQMKFSFISTHKCSFLDLLLLLFHYA